MEENRQLALLAKSNPTVLCIALGFHADQVSTEWEIEDFLEKSNQDVSLIAVFGSAFCRKVCLYRNPSSSQPLSESEAEEFVKLASHGKEGDGV